MRTAAATLIAFAALWIAASEYLHLRWTDPDEPVEAIRSMQFSQPWGGLAAKEAARFLETRWRLDARQAEAGLRWYFGNYPLHAERWMLLSRIAQARGADEAELTDLLATAISVRPHRAELRWQAANLAQITGRPSLVFRQLRLLLEISPNATDRALFVGSRWAEDPAQLLDEILPPGEEYLRQAMHRARRSGSMALAEAVRVRLEAHIDGGIGPDHPAFADYIYLAQRHDPARMVATWGDVDDHYRPGDLPAGDFAYPVDVLPAFGWSLRMPEGASLTRVPLEGSAPQASRPPSQDLPSNGANRKKAPDQVPGGEVGGVGEHPAREAHALRIRFSGEHNLRLNTPAVRFPADEPGMYRLRGWWRAEGLTTRSLPFLWFQTRSEAGRTRERIDVPENAFGWTPFEIDYRVEEPRQTVLLRLRRNSTDAFDRYIEGEVRLAGLSARRLLPSAGRPAPDSAWQRVRLRLDSLPECESRRTGDSEATPCREPSVQ